MTKSVLSVRFGAEVRRRREGHDLSLDDLAMRCGLTPNFIGTIENGKRDPSLSTILAIARGLRVKAWELFPATTKYDISTYEAARLFEEVRPDLQGVILSVVRGVVKRRRPS
jgi:transcriptional regulator with XRE-family HTH domain